jgi:hypothetical protein
MKFGRASVAMLLVFIGLMGVGFAALRVASRLWANFTFSLALTALVASVAFLIYRRGPRRSFWAGFALFGWTYFGVAFGPSAFNPWRDLLVSSPVLALLEERLLEQPIPAPPGRFQPPAAPRSRVGPYVELSPWTYWTATDRSNPFSSDSFQRIGHSLFCLGIATMGGAFCRVLRDARDEPGPTP